MMPSRILVVDDEPGMIRVVERVLGSVHEVRGTRSSRAAVDLAETFAPHLAILDVRMPELDGFELMVELKTRHPQLDIILMTGSVDDFDDKLIRAIKSRAFYFIQKPFDRAVLETLVARCLELRWRREENRRQMERLERELGEARVFQRSLLPRASARLHGARIECRYHPCARLGGDLFDYAAAPDGRIALLVADVSGHGVSAAMLTGVVKSAFRASEVDDYAPLSVVRRLSQGLAAFGHDRFVSVFCGVLAPADGVLRYVSAGHPDGLLRGADGAVRRLPSTGIIVSPALGARQWQERTVPMAADDLLLLYTDGVSEPIADADGSDACLVDLLQRFGAAGHQEMLLEAILAAVSSVQEPVSGPDDLTLLTASLRPDAAGPEGGPSPSSH
jgi:sigma-B regulation protein RsbU (phosphoserine phosphatase)